MPIGSVKVSAGTMKTEIEVNLDEDVFKIKAFLEKLPKAMNNIALEGQEFWNTLAGQKLKTSRRAYQAEISVEKWDGSSIRLYLGDRNGKMSPLVEMVEFGKESFDLKPGFLAGRRYRIIPLNISRKEVMGKPDMYRTVSVNSPPDSWIHPGFAGVNLGTEVIEELMGDIVDKHIQALIKGL